MGRTEEVNVFWRVVKKIKVIDLINQTVWLKFYPCLHSVTIEWLSPAPSGGPHGTLFQKNSAVWTEILFKLFLILKHDVWLFLR